MKTHLSHILPVWQACEILGEKTVHRIVASLLHLRQTTTSSNKPKNPEQLQEEVNVLVKSLFYQHPVQGATEHTPLPPSVAQSWKRWLTLRTLALDKTTLLQFLVPSHAQPHTGPSGHMGLFDCWVYALQGHAPSSSATYYGGVSSQLVWVPDLLILLAVCQNYRGQLQNHHQQRNSGSSQRPSETTTETAETSMDSTQHSYENGNHNGGSKQEDGDDNVPVEGGMAKSVEQISLNAEIKEEREEQAVDPLEPSNSKNNNAPGGAAAAGSEQEKSAWTMALLSFRMYDAYQKKGSVTRDTIHRFLTDVHGEDSYKEAPVRSLLDIVFADVDHATGWLHATCSEQQFCRNIAETVRPVTGSHVLMDWISILACAMIPSEEMPPSVTAYLETMDHQPRPLCDIYRLTEHRLYEIKRRFHSMVQSSSPVIHGDPMASSPADASMMAEEQAPKHVISRAAFVQAVSTASEEMGTGGYLPISLAELTFRVGCRGGGGGGEDLDFDYLDGDRLYWGLYHVLQFGGTAVRHNTSQPEDPDIPLLRFMFGMFQVSSSSAGGGADADSRDGHTASFEVIVQDKRILTRDQIGHMLLLMLEHAKFRLTADSPPFSDEKGAEDEESPTASSSTEDTMVDLALASLLGLLPPKLNRSAIQAKSNGKASDAKVALKQLVEYVLLQADTGTSSLNFDQFCRWNKASPVDGPRLRLGPLMTDLRMVAAVLFGIPPTLASMEVALIAEIQRRHKYRYTQTDVSRRGPRGTVWYIINNEWFKDWAILVKKVSGTSEDAQDGRDDSKSDFVRGLGRISNKSLLADNGSLALRGDIRWRHDYEILPPLAWSALQAWYDGGPPIHRTVVPYFPSSGPANPHSSVPRIRTENEIELYPYFVTVFLCDATSRGEARPFQQYVPLSRVSPVGIMQVQLCKGLDTDPDLARIWVMGRNPDGLKDESSEDWILNLRTNIVEQRKRRNCSADHGGITLLLELKDKKTGLWPRGLDGKEWAFREKAAIEPDASDTGDGIVGLYNMGNTCYMNSSLQCLSHTPIFREYFTSKAYLKDINTTNPLGHQGRLAQVSAVLINSLWKQFSQAGPHQLKRVTTPGSYALVNAASLTPKTFKDSIGKFNDHFQGNEQHDAQELLAFLLGGLSEDLNRIVDKPYIEAPDSDGRPDSELADIWWSNHLKREMSIIVAIFTGQYKSLLTCRSCKYESARFEPFSFLQLPLPEDDYLSVMLVLYPLRGGAETMKYCVRVRNDGKLREVLVALAKVIHEDNVGEASDASPNGIKNKNGEDHAETDESKKESDEVLRISEGLAVVDMRDGYIFKIAPNSWSLQDLQNKDSGELPLLHVYELEPVPPNGAGSESSEKANAATKADENRVESDADTTDDSSADVDNKAPTVRHSFLAVAQRRSEAVAQDYLHPLAHRVFGIPLLLRVVDLEKRTGQQVYDLVAKRLRNVVPKSALRFLADTSSASRNSDTNEAGSTHSEQSNKTSRHSELRRTTTDMEEVSAGPMPRYGFRLRLTTRDGRRCLICPWYQCCIGCLIPDDDTPTTVMDGDSIVVDWHFAVDVATSSFGLRTTPNDPIVKHPSPSRARIPAISVKTHRSCGSGATKGGHAGAITLEDCLDAFAEEERIPEAYCSGCKDFRVQTKCMSLWRLPPVVIIQLKRFQFTQHMRRKLRDLVVFPLEGFDLSRIMAPDSIPQSNPKKDGTANGQEGDATQGTETTDEAPFKDNGRSSMLYDLYGVVHHQGALSGGHYVASLKSELDGQWRLFNDAQIYEIHPRDVVDSSAYILFYIRRDVAKAQVSDFWDVREGEGLNEEDLDQLLKGRSDRCVIS